MNMEPNGEWVVDETEPQDLLPPRTRPTVDEEESYGIEELFFSRTDGRGVIQSYNETFERIAGFSAEELMGAPHKLVRHGDVPKAVFWLLWNGLKAGVPVGAYVKNRTKSGKYYWVFAVASPIEGGFLSVRMKPSSALFDKVQALYDRVLQDEQDLGLSAEDSAKRLLSTLAELGFPTYAMFQAQAFYTEFEARREALQASKCPILSSVDLITGNADIFQKELRRLARQFDHAVLLITNMEIVANKQQAGQSVLREIARNYSLKMRALQSHLDKTRVQETYSGTWGASRDQTSYFLLCASHLMRDMVAQFEDQPRQADGVSNRRDSRYLRALLDGYQQESLAAVGQSVEAALELKKNTERLRELILTLSNIRIACRVEMARLSNTVGGLQDILQSLDVFHDEVDVHLSNILNAAEGVVKGVEQTMDDAGSNDNAAPTRPQVKAA